MTSFQEFLRKKADEQLNDDSRERRKEWIASLDRLCDQIVAWLKEDDTDGILEIIREEEPRSEARLGVYKVPALKLGLGEMTIYITPVGRNTVGSITPRGETPKPSLGRVDIRRLTRKYMLFRTVTEDHEVWYAVDEGFVNPKLFDKERLEEILLELLS
jgi:hypothetical protein